MEGNAATQWQNRERYSGGEALLLLLSKDRLTRTFGTEGGREAETQAGMKKGQRVSKRVCLGHSETSRTQHL